LRFVVALPSTPGFARDVDVAALGDVVNGSVELSHADAEVFVDDELGTLSIDVEIEADRFDDALDAAIRLVEKELGASGIDYPIDYDRLASADRDSYGGGSLGQ
jgi:hypothetical protein